jgi:hypothetical protein
VSWRSLVLALAVAGLAATGCAAEDEAGATAVDEVKPLEVDFVPSDLLGLDVEAETVSGIEDVRQSYVEAVQLYSVRDGDQLVATLQVGRFASGVEWATRRFQRSVLTQVGSTTPREVRVGDDVVFLTAGVKQRLAVWFRDGYLFVLGTRAEFELPRSLLRASLEEVQP